MFTVRQLERSWQSRTFRRIVSDLLTLRPEFSLHLESQVQGPAAAAALAVLRLDELGQSFVPLASKLVREIIAGQQADGGWGDPVSTALCLRALLTDRGQGQAVNRAVKYLTDLQKADGAWPAAPMRRLPSDAFTTAYILMMLAEAPAFHSTVRTADGAEWMRSNQKDFDANTSKLWTMAQRRLKTARASASPAPALWS